MNATNTYTTPLFVPGPEVVIVMTILGLALVSFIGLAYMLRDRQRLLKFLPGEVLATKTMNCFRYQLEVLYQGVKISVLRCIGSEAPSPAFVISCSCSPEFRLEVFRRPKIRIRPQKFGKLAAVLSENREIDGPLCLRSSDKEKAKQYLDDPNVQDGLISLAQQAGFRGLSIRPAVSRWDGMRWVYEIYPVNCVGVNIEIDLHYWGYGIGKEPLELMMRSLVVLSGPFARLPKGN